MQPRKLHFHKPKPKRTYKLQYTWTDKSRYLLADVLVLVQPFLSNVGLAQVHTELQVLLHNRLVNLLPCSVLLALDDIVEGIQGTLSLAHINELCKKVAKLVGWKDGGGGDNIHTTHQRNWDHWHCTNQPSRLVKAQQDCAVVA